MLVAKDENVQIDRLELGSFNANCYLVVCRPTREGVLVDAPAEAGKILEFSEGVDLKFLLLTHSHIDHIGAVSELEKELKIPVGAHPLDVKNLTSQPEVRLVDGSNVSFGNLRMKVLHTPGHTPGSLCFILGSYLFSGDTIFPEGPGKTGTPSDFKQIVESITGKIFVLPEETRIFPGHGDPTVIRDEKRKFAVFSSRTHKPGLCGDVLWLSS